MARLVGKSSASGRDNAAEVTDSGALKVDIGSATLSVTADGVEIKNDAGNPIPVNDNGGSLTVDAVSLPLPTGAATEAKQDTLIGHVDGVEALLTTIDADTGSIDGKLPSGLTVASTRLLVDGSGVTQPVSGTINTLTGLDIPKHDNIQLTYTGENLTGVAYRVGSTTVATLTLAYTGTRLDSVTKS